MLGFGAPCGIIGYNRSGHDHQVAPPTVVLSTIK